MFRILSLSFALILAQLGLVAVAPSGSAISSEAEATFGGKVKNIRIRERNNSQGYRVIVIVKDDTNNEVLDVDRATVTVSDPNGSDAATFDLVDTKKVVQRHTWEGPLFDQSAVGFPYELLVELSSATGEVLGYVWLDTSVQSLMATDEDLGDEQDAGWLTDAGDVTLASGEVVGLHAGIRDQGDGTQKVVVKVTGDSDLAAEGIVDATVTLGSTNGGPEAAVAPTAGVTSSRQVLILKKGQATGPMDDILAAADASGQVAIGASLFDANNSVLLVQPDTVSALGNGNNFNVTVAPDAAEAVTSITAAVPTDATLAEATGTGHDFNMDLDALYRGRLVAPGDPTTDPLPIQSIRSGTQVSWNEGADPGRTLSLVPGDAPILVENIFTSPTSDELYVGIGACGNESGITALPVDGTAEATVHLDLSDDGRARFTLTSGTESIVYLTDIVPDGSDTSDTSDSSVTGAISATSSVDVSTDAQGGAPTGDTSTTGDTTDDDGSTSGTGTSTGGTSGTSSLGEAGVLTTIDGEGNWVRDVIQSAATANGGGKTYTCTYGCYNGTNSLEYNGGQYYCHNGGGSR